MKLETVNSDGIYFRSSLKYLVSNILKFFTSHLLNIGYVSNETNEDVCMYIEEFILVENWIHCCTKLNS